MKMKRFINWLRNLFRRKPAQPALELGKVHEVPEPVYAERVKPKKRQRPSKAARHLKTQARGMNRGN